MRSSCIRTACFYRILEAFVFSPSQSCIFKGTDTIGQYYLLIKSCVHVTSLLLSVTLWINYFTDRFFQTLLHELWKLCFIQLREVLKMVQLRLAVIPSPFGDEGTEKKLSSQHGSFSVLEVSFSLTGPICRRLLVVSKRDFIGCLTQ